MSERAAKVPPALDAYVATCYETGSDGTVYFTDPLTRERITPGAPPSCVQENGACQRGLAKLRELGPHLRVRMLLGAHGSAADFVEQQRQHAAILARSSVVAIEANFNPASPQVESMLAQGPGRGEYQRAQLAWLRQHNKQVLPCDIDKVQSEFHHSLAERFSLMMQVPEGESPTEQHERNLQRMILDTSYQYLREWAMIAQLGTWCDTLDLPAEQLDMAWMLGSWHATSFAAKLRWCGAKVTEYITEETVPDEYLRYGELCASAFTQARILPEYQNITVPF